MRIISQDGEFDIPYNSCIFQRYRNVIWCINNAITADANGYHLAEYSSEEKALKAMEMLRAKYRESKLKYHLITGCVNADFYEDTMKKLLECAYFQFPKDDEVEV